MPTATWERLPQERRAAVIEAAEAEFAARGFSHGSLNTICREAGVSKGSLFQYFTDKADMYVYLADRASRRIRAAIEAEAARLHWNDDFYSSMLSLTETWVRYFYDHPRDLAMTAATNLEPDQTARASVREVVNEHYTEVLSPLLDAARDNGQLTREADPQAILAVLLVLLPHLAIAPHVRGLDSVMGLEASDAEQAAAAGTRMIAVAVRPYVR
ncbi:TetR/AcrR family transcriptional regulator [Rhodococcus triatomae]|uniref:DNA-binding transcriptional regulator, AcrR family n=1 Tax=Rhodococcus triatomae TaxID=300028 RepID=A0A1G8H063_9NOCA|nr:TetR/AcrR family transcriptional regulator [Rhodococcus triatomae]QNG20250.1 TetR/AcrR family transcriptional regulator [Rhodococcus triatomae]QNG23835.1 TetR/AcrR family transcriptional regulator [Rhodococcus triatomae]SDH99880.1 DNA-binding transcriptional regulator, AcrR family [Rhodococcus triatomae]